MGNVVVINSLLKKKKQQGKTKPKGTTETSSWLRNPSCNKVNKVSSLLKKWPVIQVYRNTTYFKLR